MSVAVSIKVNDGIVLAADSAATMRPEDGQGVDNVYDNANKVFNLVKNLPIGMITWGAGSIGIASTATLAKDLRKKLMTAGTEWHVDPDNYTIESVASKVRKFFYEDLYEPVYASLAEDEKPYLGLSIAGYSSGEGMADQMLIEMNAGSCAAAELVRDHDEVGLSWYGITHPITRLVRGFDPSLAAVLQTMGVTDDQIGPAMDNIAMALHTEIASGAMPIQDAIDLARFLVDTTIQYMRFIPGAPVVGGPIEIAAITKHEGFKWIQRKLYYSDELN